jgi:hypothetical protein
MVTAIESENVKAIGKRQPVEIRTNTLFFGLSSAGKTTVLQAFHYLREILERKTRGADRKRTGGDFVDLSNFRNFIHGQQPVRAQPFSRLACEARFAPAKEKRPASGAAKQMLGPSWLHRREAE